MKSADPKPDRIRNGGRPRQLYAKDDPRYQPTRAELEEDVSIPDATPHDLAQAMFRRPLPKLVPPGEPYPVIRHDS